jgi:hypothetical protein
MASGQSTLKLKQIHATILFLMANVAIGGGQAALAQSSSTQGASASGVRAAPPVTSDADAQAALAERFTGVTADGKPVPRLFSIQKTGISTASIYAAAAELVASLSPEQKAKVLFPVDGDEWRQWNNIPQYRRQGVSLAEMHPEQREKVFALLKESLSLRGFETARSIMRLNETLAEMTGKRDWFGENLYWITVMGTPSADGPWGWQLDGHHLVINYFILKDQIVMTPTFMGSEPVQATTGKYAGTRVFQREEQDGLALIRALTPEQRGKAIVADEVTPDLFTGAFRDNVELQYMGIRYDELSAAQQALLLRLIETYVGNIRPGHAEVKMSEVKQHLPETYFAWMGGFDDEKLFYYRVHSPVVLIEFDHVRGFTSVSRGAPVRNHVHTIVRTPNGNDYGQDLLRQHREQFDHGAGSTHTH